MKNSKCDRKIGESVTRKRDVTRARATPLSRCHGVTEGVT